MSFKHATGTTAPTSTSVTEEASEVSVNSRDTTAKQCIPVPKKAVSVSFKDSLLWRSTCLWKSVHSD